MTSFGITPLSASYGEATVEAQGQFPSQAQGGVGLAAYQAIVGVAARTLVRQSDIIPTVAANFDYLLFRAPVTGLTLVTSVFVPTNGAAPAQAQCAAGPNAGVLGGVAKVLLHYPFNSAIGFFNNLQFSAAPFPLFLFPGDVLLMQVLNAAGTGALEAYLQIAEYAS